MASNLYEYYTGQGKALPSLQERGNLFESYGLGAANTYAGTAAQNTALLSKLNTPTQTSPAITPAAVTDPVKPLTVPQYAPPPIPTLPELMAGNQNSTEVNALQGQQNTIISNVGALVDKQATKTARKGELEVQAGLPELGKSLNQINQEITALNTGASQAILQSEGRLAHTFAIYGEQAQIERTRASRMLGLAAVSQALQGNVALAQDSVQRALDAEFGGIESQLKYQELLLNLNKDRLTAAEKKQADAFQATLTERTRLLEQQKADRTATLNLATKLGEFNVPASIISKVLAAKTPEDAIALAAPYMQDPKAQLELEKLKLDMAYTRAQTAKLQKETTQGTAEERKQAAADAQAKSTELQKASSALTVISQLKAQFVSPKTSSGASLSSTGQRAVGPLSSKFPTFRGETADFERAHDQLKALLSLDNYKLLKGTGQISNYEGQLLANAATQLDLNMSEKGYVSELNKLETAFNSILANSASSILAEDEKDALSSFFFNSTGDSLTPANYFK